MDWSKLDPNTVLIVGSLVGSFGTWLWHKISGDKTDSFDETIRGLGKQAIHELLMDPSVSAALSAEAMQAKAEAFLTAAASKLGLPINTITTAIIKTTAAHVVGDAQEQLRAITDATAQLAKMADDAKAFQDRLATIEKEAFERGKKFADEMVERVDPNAPAAPATPTP
jgi:hypothetical protein